MSFLIVASYMYNTNRLKFNNDHFIKIVSYLLYSNLFGHVTFIYVFTFLTKSYILLLNYLHLCLFNIDRWCSINNIHVCSGILSCTSADTKYNVRLFFYPSMKLLLVSYSKETEKGRKEKQYACFFLKSHMLLNNPSHTYNCLYYFRWI